MPRRILAVGLLLGSAGCGLLGPDEAARSAVPAVHIVERSPVGQIPSTRTVRVRFSEPVVRPEAVGRPVAPGDVLVVTPSLGGHGRWIAPDTFELAPGRPLAPNTRYTVRVRERTVGSGRRLAGERRFRFHTPLFRVISAHGVRDGSSLQAVVEVSHAVGTEDAAGAVTFRDADDEVVAARLLGSGAQTILRFRVPPEGLDPEEGLAMRVEPTLTPECGGAALDKAVEIHILFDPPAAPDVYTAEAIVTPYGPAIRVRLNTDVDEARAIGHVDLTPPAQVRMISEHHGFRLVGELVPGVTYRLLLPEAFPTRLGALGAPVEFEVVLPDLPPSVRFDPVGPHLSISGDTLRVVATNVPRLRARAVRVPDRNIAHIDLAADHGLASLGRLVAEVERTGSLRPNEPMTVDLPLSSLLRGGRGLYRIEVEDPDRAWVRSRGWLLQRDLLVTAKLGTDYLRARVQSIAGEPASGAQVTVYSRTGRRLFVLPTGSDGVAEYAGALDVEDPVAWVVAQHGRGAAYLPILESEVHFDSSVGAQRRPAFVWTDRDYYRPGETIEGFVLVEPRGAATAAWRVDLSGPEGPVAEAIPAGLDTRGLARTTFTIPADAPPGPYQVRVLEGPASIPLGRADLYVVAAELEPLRLRIEPKPSNVGGPIPFDVEVSSRFGGRTVGFPITGRCHYAPVAVSAPDLVGFRFGIEGRPVRERAMTLEAVAEPVQAGGRATVTCPALPQDVPPGYRVQVELRASVQEPGGRPVSRTARTLADAVSTHVGLRHRGGRLEVVTVDPEGQAMGGVGLRAAIWPADAGNSGRPRARVAVTTQAGPTPIAFEAPRAGHYRAEVESADGNLVAGRRFWVLTGSAAYGLPHVEVEVPFDPQPVGGALTADLALPFAGRLRVTVERARVLHEQVLQVEGRRARVSIPVLSSYAPNARVVVALEGRDGRRAYGAAPIRVLVDDRRLEIEASLPKGTEGRRFPVQLRIKGARGPARAIVSIVPADRLSEQAAARRDPFVHFLAPTAPRMTTHDPLGLSASAERLGSATLPSEHEALFAPQFPLAASEAFVSKVTAVSARGLGYLFAELPPSGGRPVLMVVAFDGQAYGVATIPLADAARAAAHLSAPQSILRGDRVQVPLTVENASGVPWSVTASVSVAGSVERRGPGRVQMNLPAGQRRTVDFTIEATQVGRGTVRALVEAGSDVVETEASVGVSQASKLVVRGGSGSVGHREPLTLPLPEGIDPTAAEVRLVVGPGLVHGHAAALDALRNPRSDELPDVVGLGLGLLAAPEMARDQDRRSGPDPVKAELRAALRRVAAAVGPDGSSSLWTSGPSAGPEVETQVGLLIAEARRTGQPGLDDAWAAWARRAEARVGEPGRPDGQRAQLAFVLARGGERRFEIPEELTATGGRNEVRALISPALTFSGRGAQGRPLVFGDFEPPKQTIALAWTLLGLATAAPGHPSIDGLAEALVARARNGRWSSPGEDGLALFALRARDRAKGPGRAYWGSVTVGDKVLKRFNATRVTVLRGLAAAWRPAVTLTVTGAGEARAGLSAVGVLEAGDDVRSAGLEVIRRHHRPSEGPSTAGRSELGALWAVEVLVTARSAEGRGPTVVRLPIAAGFGLERIWPTEIEGLAVRPVGAVDPKAGHLIWRVVVGEEPVRLVYTVRAVRPGRFTEAPVEAWRIGRPDVLAQTDAPRWIVTTPE